MSPTAAWINYGSYYGAHTSPNVLTDVLPAPVGPINLEKCQSLDCVRMMANLQDDSIIVLRLILGFGWRKS